MGKFNFMKILKYGAAAMAVFAEVSEAIADGRLTTQEALKIIQTAVRGADIKGVDVNLIEIKSRDDGGFIVDFPYAAIKDWALDFNFD